jgi:plasmid stabilization system protein ParE
MARKIIWSETASEDLKEIVLFIAIDNPIAATDLAERILDRIETAAQLETK